MSQLAINGGQPVAPKGLRCKWPVFDVQDRAALLEVLESGHWCSVGWSKTFGSRVAQFEQEFAAWNGNAYAVAVNSGTSALVLALRAVGIKAGDEVIVPAVTFVASASAIVLANAVPIFVDIDPETYQIDPDAVEAAITDRTRAIMVVHYGGYPADMDRILAIAKRHKLKVVEDCAEGHGSEWRGTKIGALGDAGAFSFQMGKPLTCGEGGIVTMNDVRVRDACFSYANMGRSRDGAKYVHYVPAHNFRLSEFLGKLLSVQLTRLDDQIAVRHANGEYLAAELAKIDGVSALKRDPRITKRSYYFYFLRYDAAAWNGIPRDAFRRALGAEGIGLGTAHNQPLYLNPAFTDTGTWADTYGIEYPDYSKVTCPESERVYRNEICALTKDFLMHRENGDLILAAIRKLRANIGEIPVA
ncbi:MAG: DegT/DnrJ/EryC1/StrS family aminotransferase [Kiritimatiellae bacterium]|nr:DegT/DnrJ/EryC1/StrS family aminotransferase [Kiritimatiellia bacterium]